jgi:hypothetical protein
MPGTGSFKVGVNYPILLVNIKQSCQSATQARCLSRALFYRNSGAAALAEDGESGVRIELRSLTIGE